MLDNTADVPNLDKRRHDWTDERIQRLKQLWAEGHSCSQIAADMGGITRNAVIGKVHRLDLAGRITAAPRYRSGPVSYEEKLRRNAERLARKVIAQAQRAAWSTTSRRQRAARPPCPPTEPAPIAPDMQPCTLQELQRDSCRWPIGHPGEADFYFCGGARLSGHSYCGFHKGLAYQRPLAARAYHPLGSSKPAVF
jgi:GcrA cell cycle regulator